MDKRLNKAYKQMLANIRGIIQKEHHPTNIKEDDPEIMEHIQAELDKFNVLCKARE